MPFIFFICGDECNYYLKQNHTPNLDLPSQQDCEDQYSKQEVGLEARPSCNDTPFSFGEWCGYTGVERIDVNLSVYDTVPWGSDDISAQG